MPAAHPIVTVDHGRVEIPADLREDPRFRDGARLVLVPLGGTEDQREAKGDWRGLRGIFADSPIDLNEERRKERQLELERDDHWRD